MISNQKVINYIVANIYKNYNLGLRCFSIWGTFRKQNNSKFKLFVFVVG